MQSDHMTRNTVRIEMVNLTTREGLVREWRRGQVRCIPLLHADSSTSTHLLPHLREVAPARCRPKPQAYRLRWRSSLLSCGCA